MTTSDRLRQHPEDRLASPVQLVNLAAAAQRLRAEQHDPVAGHRQIAIVRHGGATLILFVFEADGLLKEHRADGAIMIQVLTGRFQVGVGDGINEVGPGEILALAPEVPHSVRALVPGEMLLTVLKAPGNNSR